MYSKLLLLLTALALEASALPAAQVYAPQKSPVFPALAKPTGVVTSAPTPGAAVPTGPLPKNSYHLKGYPDTWATPPTNSAEVKAAIKQINWNYVPNAKVKTFDSNGNPITKGYSSSDPDCWWSDTLCDNPKVKYLPADITYCPKPGNFNFFFFFL